MKKILILYAHPSPHRSVINKALLRSLDGLENVLIHDLYAAYPHFLIDVKYEQKLCIDHDIIIIQHPLYWYSAPALVKEWIDNVLEYNWAYGTEDGQLRGKIFFNAISAGGDEKSYSKAGFNNFSLIELLRPFQAMAQLCSMDWLPPFATLGIHRACSPENIAVYAENYRRIIVALRDDQVNLKKATKAPFLNHDLDKILGK